MGAEGKLFISYASEDAETANEICAIVEDAGVPCWIAPRDIPPGDWPDAIAGAVESCRAMLVVVSAAANASGHMKREIALAADRAPLIPVRIEDVKPAPGLNYYLNNKQWVTMVPGPVARHRAALLAAVAGDSPVEPAPKPQPAARGRWWPVLGFTGVAVAALAVWLAVRAKPTVGPEVIKPGNSGGRVIPARTRDKFVNPPVSNIVRTADALEHDGISGYRLVDIVRNGSFWRCNIEIDYTYDKRHHPVSVVGGVVDGQNVRTREWGFWGDRGDERDEGAFKRGTRRVSMAVEVHGDEAQSRELRLFIAAGDPPGEVFYTRKFPFVRTWKRP
jgi:hypothetical protein